MSARFWLIGNLRDRRIGHWRRALAAAGVTAGQIDCRELLRCDGALERIREGDCVRLDSPGEDLEPYCLLTCHGYVDAQAEGLVTAISPEFRLFVKPAHGSSASGMVALRLDPDRPRALSTAYRVCHAEGLRLYNSLRIRYYRTEAEVNSLIDRLCADGCHRGGAVGARLSHVVCRWRRFLQQAHAPVADAADAVRREPLVRDPRGDLLAYHHAKPRRAS